MKFESRFVKSLQAEVDFLEEPALIYRLPMVRYNRQGFDIYSDSIDPDLYRAFECKSMDFSEPKPLYFSAAFHVSNGIHQLDYENDILTKSGREGFLAVELRREPLRHSTVSVIPFWDVMIGYNAKRPSISIEDLIYYQAYVYQKGLYVRPDDEGVFEELS